MKYGGKGVIFLQRDNWIFYGIYIILNIILVGILLSSVNPNYAGIVDPYKPENPKINRGAHGWILFIKGDDLILRPYHNVLEVDGVQLPPLRPPEIPKPPVRPAPPEIPVPPQIPKPPEMPKPPEVPKPPETPEPPQPEPPKDTEPNKPNEPTEPPKPKPQPEPPRPVANIIYSGGASIKQVALTFDDGPDPNTLDSILSILDEYNAKATFFLLGQRAKNSGHLVQRIYDKGHQVANHSNSHPRFSTLNWKDAVKEITVTEKILGEYQSHKYFRPPYGDYNTKTLEVAYDLGYRVIYWNVDTRDWAATNPKQIVDAVKQKTKPGSIILFHEGKQLTLKALPEVLQWLTQEGYTFVTMAELLGEEIQTKLTQKEGLPPPS